MSTLAQQAALAVSPGFQSRVQAAMVAAAAAILAEAPGSKPVTEALRQQLATAVMDSAAPFIPRFSWGCAVNATVAADLGATVVAIASTAAGPPAAVTTSSVHGLTSGQVVAITGAADPSLNGMWPVTVTSTTVFTIPQVGSAAGTAGGTVTVQPTDADINTAVASIWNDIAGVQNQTQ